MKSAPLMGNRLRYAFLYGVVVLAMCAVPGQSEAVSRSETEVQQYLDGLYEEVLGLLPEAMRTSLQEQPVVIQALALNETLVPSDFCADNGKIFGRLDGERRLVVSLKLVLLSMTEGLMVSESFPCKHRTYKQTVKATIVHELAHLYDQQKAFSSKDRFRRFTGGEKRSGLLRQISVRNYNYVNSPDTYEYRNLRESFAVNLEYYVLDDSFRCRRPAMTKLFDREFGIPNTSCENYDSILVNSQIAGDNYRRAVSLSADNVYQVHYLFATEAGNIASRWGHAMFRLVMCNPERDSKGPDCLGDLSHDVVLSYRANVSDITINYLSGLIGQYPSQLFVYDMPEMIKEYTRYEFRNLISVPLDLTADELDTFLKVTLERYWNYEGRYYFVTNHCGTESANHLRVASGEKSQHVRARTPRKMLKTIGKSPLVDRHEFLRVVEDRVSGPNYFPSREKQYADAFAELHQAGVFHDMEFRKILKDADVLDRQKVYVTFLDSEEYQDLAETGKRHIVGNMLLIERMLQGREAEKISSEILAALRKDSTGLIEDLREVVRQMHGQPWEVINDGHYGVPHEESIARFIDQNANAAAGNDIISLLQDYQLLEPVLAKVNMQHEVQEMLESHLVASIREPRVAVGGKVEVR